MYKTKYILPFTNDLNEFYEIYFDFLDYTEGVTQLIGTEDVLTIRSTGGDENKLEPILGTEALINIFVDEDTPLTIADLIAQHDNDIRVTVYRDEDYSKSIFQGFIVVEDNSQPFLDRPYILSVRALDGLGLLKGVDLVDADNLRFVGSFSIVSWIAQILHKTGQGLNLRVYFNFFESSFATNIGTLEQVYLNAITFSQGDAFNMASDDPSIDINATSADDCYTALEKIVRCLRCRLFQEDGRWNLVSLYEYLNHDGFSYKEYAFGDPVDGIVPFTVIDAGMSRDYRVPVGKNEIVHPFNEDQVLYLKLATKWIKLTFNYDQSQNKVCNQDFSEGDRNDTYDETINSAIIDPTIQPPVDLQTLGYDAYCWEHLNGPSGVSPYPSSPATSNAFIRAVIDRFGYETDRFLVLNNVTDITYMRSNKFLVDISDIINLSLMFRTRVDIHYSSESTFPIAYLNLYGDDGTFWTLSSVYILSSPQHRETMWLQTDENFNHTGGPNPAVISSDIVSDTTQWTSISTDVQGTTQPLPKVPVSGQVELLIAAWGLGQPLTEYWYKNVEITILPYLQGAYRQLKGDYNFSGSNNDIKQTLSEDVEISDSPKRYFKGALLKPDGLSLTTTTWRRFGRDENLRFTQLMERVMFNHLYRIIQKLEGTWRGLVYRPEDDISVIRPNGYLCRYLFTDHDVPTKEFMLTSFEKNYGTGQWRGVFLETLADQNADGFINPDNYKFNYIFQ